MNRLGQLWRHVDQSMLGPFGLCQRRSAERKIVDQRLAALIGGGPRGQFAAFGSAGGQMELDRLGGWIWVVIVRSRFVSFVVFANDPGTRILFDVIFDAVQDSA